MSFSALSTADYKVMSDDKYDPAYTVISQRRLEEVIQEIKNRSVEFGKENVVQMEVLEEYLGPLFACELLKPAPRDVE